eukprot:2501181-Alexandrium_andersonii.AAC.1
MDLGDVREISAKHLESVRARAPGARWVVICAGSPCQDLSGLNAGGVGLGGTRSSLFFEISR